MMAKKPFDWLMITPPKTLWLTVKLAKSKTLEIQDGRQAVKGTNIFFTVNT